MKSPPTFRPLYGQIRSLIERSLEAREWAPGQAIPSELDLASRFGVSQGTVRKAVQALAAGNLLVRRQGKGTFVATHTEEKASNFRFLRIRRNDGQAEYPRSRLLGLRRTKANGDVARALGLRPGEPVLVLRRVLEFAGSPAVLDESLYAVSADAASGALLRVATGSPLLAVDRIAYTYGDRPVEWRRGLCATR